MSVKIYSNNPKVQLKEIILRASPQESQRNLWNTFIDNISDDEANSILEVLRDDAKNLDFLTKNLQEKMKAMQTKDKKAWKKIIKEEKEFIDGK